MESGRRNATTDLGRRPLRRRAIPRRGRTLDPTADERRLRRGYRLPGQRDARPVPETPGRARRQRCAATGGRDRRRRRAPRSSRYAAHRSEADYRRRSGYRFDGQHLRTDRSAQRRRNRLRRTGTLPFHDCRRCSARRVTARSSDVCGRKISPCRSWRSAASNCRIYRRSCGRGSTGSPSAERSPARTRPPRRPRIF